MNPVVWKMFTYFSEVVGANHDKNNYELISIVYEMINCFHGYSYSQLLFFTQQIFTEVPLYTRNSERC